MHNTATAEALKPYYRQFCKRPCFNDDYLPTFNRPNVTLVDTKGKGVDRITETGVVVDGREYEVDCLIFATGFEVGTGYTRRAGYEIIGRDGLKLSESGRTACRPSTGSTAGASRTASSSASPRPVSPPTTTTCCASRPSTSPTSSVTADERRAQPWRPPSRPKTIGRPTSGGWRPEPEFFAGCTPGYYNNEGKTGNGNGLLAAAVR